MTAGSPGGSRPPAWVRLMLRVLLPRQDREFYLGDLEEGGRRPWLREIAGVVALRLGRGGGTGRAAERWGAGRGSGSSRLRAMLRASGRFPGAIRSDLRLGFRRLLGNPGATLTSLTALSLGIGLSALLFSLISGTLLPVLPFEAGDRIVRVGHTDQEPVSAGTLDYWSERQSSFEGLGAWADRPVNVTVEGGTSELAIAAAMTGDGLSLLSTRPYLGRLFTEEDADPGAPAVVLVGHGLWRTRLGSDPGVLGRIVRVDGEPAEIVGVMPEGFRFPFFHELWMPLRLDALRPERNLQGQFVFGVLREGVPVEAAAAELTALERQRPRPALEPEPAPVEVPSFTDVVNPRGRQQQLAGMLIAVAILVLLVACANATNVLLAQSVVRSREVAVRAALGATRSRIATQFWLEVSLLAAAAAVGGTVLAALGVGLVRNAVPSSGGLPFWFEFRVDRSVLAFVVVAAVLAAMTAGVGPALHATRANHADLLKDSSRGTSSHRLGRVMGRLISVEMAVSFVLLVMAGLCIRSAVNLRRYDFAFEPEGVYATWVRLPDGRYESATDRAALVDRIEERLSGVRGASSFTLATALPGTASSARGPLAVEGRHDPAGSELPETRYIAVSPGYFETFRAPALTGRVFDARDGAGSLPVAVVNRAFEQAWLPDGAAGRRIAVPAAGEDPEWLTVIGVVPDLMSGGLEREVETAVYRPIAQAPPTSFLVAARSNTAATSLAEPVRQVLVSVDPDMALFLGNTLDERIKAANAAWDWLSALFLIAGGVALFLAAIGLYGVMAFQVAQRTREIGVRIALGSGFAGIVGIVLRQGLRQIAAGLVAGILLAAPLALLLRGMLLDVRPLDPIVFCAVPAVLVTAAWLGCLVPALRAVRVDPQVALTAE